MSIMQMLLAADGTTARLHAHHVTALAVHPTEADAQAHFQSDGRVFYYANGQVDAQPAGEWLSSAPDPATAAGYEIRATLVSGSLSSGLLNTWEALSTTRIWVVTQTAIGARSTTLLFEIRRSGGSVEAAAEITLTATVEQLV